jgi:hypothetical protein
MSLPLVLVNARTVVGMPRLSRLIAVERVGALSPKVGPARRPHLIAIGLFDILPA